MAAPAGLAGDGMTGTGGRVGVSVGVGVKVLVGVLVGVSVGVGLGVCVSVGVGVFVGVLVFVGVGVLVGVSVTVGVGVLHRAITELVAEPLIGRPPKPSGNGTGSASIPFATASS